MGNPVDASATRDRSGLGQGLRQLQARLASAYDGADTTAGARADITATADRFSVRLSLPWHT